MERKRTTLTTGIFICGALSFLANISTTGAFAAEELRKCAYQSEVKPEVACNEKLADENGRCVAEIVIECGARCAIESEQTEVIVPCPGEEPNSIYCPGFTFNNSQSEFAIDSFEKPDEFDCIDYLENHPEYEVQCANLLRRKPFFTDYCPREIIHRRRCSDDENLPEPIPSYIPTQPFSPFPSPTPR